MAHGKKLATTQAVIDAIDELTKEGVEPTLERIKGKTGGSYTTILSVMAQIKAQFHQVPLNTEEKLRPLLDAAASLVLKVEEDTAVAFREKIDEQSRLIQELNDIVAKSEAAKEAAMEEAETKEADRLKLADDNKHLSSLLETARTELNEARVEMIKVKIREEDFQVAKKEASEARERASKLEGRLEEIELSRSTQDQAPKKAKPQH